MQSNTLLLILTMLSIGIIKADNQSHDVYGYPQSNRSKFCINTAWKFHLGDADADYYLKATNDKTWETISIPHTLYETSLTLDFCKDDKTQPTFQREVGWYRKDIEVSASSNRKVFLEFEGAHQVTDCWVNGEHVGQFAVGGYSPFHFDITDFVTRGVLNQVTLKVDNRQDENIPPDAGPFDYVKFSGLYRDVYLVETDPMHITFNWEALKAGVNITTPSVDPVNMNATINIKTVVRNEYASVKEAEVITRIIDHRGVVVIKMEESAELAAGQDYEFNQIGALEDDVQLWDVDHPYLYRVNTEVLVDGKSVDCLENKIGLRTFRLDNELGFMLNEKPIKLIGFNRHQHHAYIGDALPNSLHYKDMLQFKEMGFNVMRTAHYPHDDAIMDACDELGILVYEEAPTWITMSKNPKWWDNLELSARIMVRNHRNHPSIVIWGAGVNHRGYVPSINNAIKQEDPVRLTASQGSRWTGWQASGLTDINANMLYGPFIWDRSETMLAMEGRGGAEHVGMYKSDPKMTGIITWTAHAYHTFHPTHDKYNSTYDRTRSGYMTLFRQPKREILWYPSELKEEPYLHIENPWKASTKTLKVFSNADEVELFVNGQSFMKQKPAQDSTYMGLDHPPFIFKIDNYQNGELKAIGFKDRKEYVSASTHTPGKAQQIKLIVDDKGRDFVADGSDIMVAYARILDKNGTWVRDSVGEVSFTVSGPATIVGDGKDINANPMFIENGEAPVLIRAGYEPGQIKLTAKSKGMKSASVLINTISREDDMVKAKARPIYDFKKVRIDMGSPDQLVQFGWTEWSSRQEKEAAFELAAFDASVKVKSNSDEGILRWLGEMNVIGKYGFAYGEGVIGMDKEGLSLHFEDLKEGTYRLMTYHHAPRTNSDHMDPNKDKIKTLSIHKLPYAKRLIIQLEGQDEAMESPVTEGKQMQFEAVSTAEIIFESDGVNPVVINFKDADGAKGVWLNAFEFSEWRSDLIID